MRDGHVASDSHRDSQPGAREYKGIDHCSAVQPVDEMERFPDVYDAVMEQESVRKQWRAEDEIGDGKSFHTRVNCAHWVVADDRQTAARQDKQSQQVADNSEHADGWNKDGFDDWEATGTRLEQQRYRAAVEIKLIAEAADINCRRVEWPKTIAIVW